MEILASGYGLIEGPRVDAQGNLYFSDIPNGGVFRRTPDGVIDTIVPRRRGVGGIALHADGGLVLSGRNICRVHNGETTVYLERPEGVGGFNDLFADAAGRIYTGSIRVDPFAPDGPTKDRAQGDQQAPSGECYRIDTDGGVTVIYDGVGLSNGIGISPAGDRLYHADTNAGAIIVHDLSADGHVANRRIFARVDRGRPDGLAVDEEGGVWVASYGGGAVLRFTPGGAFDRAVDVPATEVTSLCFAGDDRRDLIIVTADNSAASDGAKPGGAIFRTRVDVPGLPAAPVRVSPSA